MEEEEEEELVWSVQELAAVRASGLVGALVGCLPRAPRQNGRLGRPLLLRREERALIREGTPSGEDPPLQDLHPAGSSDGQQGAECPELTEAQELQWEEFLSRSHEEQQQLSLNDRKSALTSSLSGRVSEAELASRLSSLESSFVFPRSALTVQLSTCRQGLPLQPIRREHPPPQPIRREHPPPQPIRREDPPPQPISSQQQSPEPMGVRLQVFRDLRRRGFYLTSGGKFGVDFLVYPGDPLRFHAHFMALCLPEGGALPVAELLSCVRLSSNVKKTLLLCSVSPPEGVIYSSLQWSHMS